MAERVNSTGTPYSGTNENRSNKNLDQAQSGEERGDEQYKNNETRVSNRESFGDDYEVAQENKMGRDEANSENENRIGRGGSKEQ